MNLIVNKKIEKEEKKDLAEKKLKRKIKYSSLTISIILFFLAIIRYLSYGNQFGLFYYLLLCSSFCFFFVFSEFTTFRYPKKIKKAIAFIASYSYTLYLFNYTLFNFYRMFLSQMNQYLLFILAYIFANILSILIASFSEIQTTKISRFLLKKFSIND
jgi:peptidoglycan/LPS O-acetylase OafA/YrhL